MDNRPSRPTDLELDLVEILGALASLQGDMVRLRILGFQTKEAAMLLGVSMRCATKALTAGRRAVLNSLKTGNLSHIVRTPGPSATSLVGAAREPRAS